ncbi:RagB/SusD family nutrient uptake outer membrane protein [Sphingobacterium kitahiroshimense]|uniref:RagB/SusD family nutrient uptake outer membrane protein n=1 Tax=Sphingobacterium kitahiroshimense TaxID=470446 RepID=A0ABV0BM87_9SPHI
MKFINNRLIVSAICLSLMATSCKKTLEVEPYSSFTSANFFENENQAYMATLGVYQSLGQQATYGWYINLIYDNDTDVSQIDGNVDANQWRAIPHYAATKESSFLDQTWIALFQGVGRANVVLAQIPKMDAYTNGSDTQKALLNRLIGEAKFLRSYFYFDLVRLFGDVPLKLTPSQTGEKFDVPSTDRYVIYDQIIKDMKEAADLLPETLPTDERINKWGAKAVLAKVALYAGGYSLRNNGGIGNVERPANYKEYYTLAKQQIDEVIGSKLYSLNDDYTKVFKNQSQHILEPKESLFEVAFFNQANSTIGGNSIGQFNAPTTVNGVYRQANARVLVLKPFFDSFDTKDIRRDFAIAAFSIDAKGRRVPYLAARGDENWKIGKWSREYQTGTLQELQSTNINTVIMRYSDVLLMRAEVENELNNGPNTLAYDAINEVRRRGYGVNTAGRSISIDVLTPGSGYSAVPTFTIVDGGGTGAIGGANLIATSGALGPMTIVTTGYPNTVNAGYGYTSVPTVTVSNPWPDNVSNWVSSKSYSVGTYVKQGSNYYRVATAGTSTSTAPSHTSGNSSAVSTGAEFTYASPAVVKATLLVKPTANDADLMSGKSKEQFFDVIVSERARELCFEGGRRGDLIRWNLLGAKIALTKSLIRPNYTYLSFANFRANQHELYPIPLSETDVNTSINQNPGY